MKLPPSALIEAEVLAMPVVRAGCETIAREVEAEAQALAQQRAYQAGTYEGMIRTEQATIGARVVAEDVKSRWLEEGTGIYGPLKTPIVPKRGKFLVFTVPTGETIFAKSVKGRDASWVMRDAAKTVAERNGLLFTNLRRYQG